MPPDTYEQLHRQALALLTTSQFLTGERSLEDLALMLRAKIRAVFAADETILFLHDDTFSGLWPVGVELPGYAVDAALLAWATATAERAMASQQAAADLLPPAEPSLACIALPLIHGSTVLGALALIRPAQSAEVLPASLWSLLTIFANVVAAACANQQLMARMRQHTETLESLVARRTAELAHSRDLLRLVFDHLPEGLLLMNADGRLLAANHMFCRSIVGRQPREVVGQLYEQLWADLAATAELRMEPQGPPGSWPIPPARSRASQRIRCTDIVGHVRWFAVDRIPVAGGEPRPMQYLERWSDVTQQAELQRRLLVQEQLTSLSRLAASVAHRLGNPLQGTISCLEICSDDQTLSPQTREYLGLAQGELEHMAQQLGTLRSLYRPPRITWGPLDANRLLREAGRLTEPQLRRSAIILRFMLDADLPPVYGQADELRQVFLNLLLSAQESMAEGGTITISSRRAPPGPWCQIQVSDTGGGMAPEQLRRLFLPFGNGEEQQSTLGFYLSKEIIEQHGGQIEVASEVRRGTTVTIRLPLDSETDDGANDDPRG